MKKINIIRLVVYAFVIFMLVITFVASRNAHKNLDKSSKDLITAVQVLMIKNRELGYAQGQLDAMHDTTRIRMINDSTCVWVSSPWGKANPIQDTIKGLSILHK